MAATRALNYSADGDNRVDSTMFLVGYSLAFSSVCLSVYPRCKACNRKTACAINTKLDTGIDVYSIAVARHALTQRSKGLMVKGQHDTVTKIVTVARLLVSDACCNAHVDSTACVF